MYLPIKGWDFLYIILMTLTKEICFEFVKVWKVTKTKIPKYKHLVQWLTKSGEVVNVNLMRMFFIGNGPLLSMLFLRSGTRCANPDLYYASLEQASLYLFLNNNFNYQILSSFELYMISVAPPPVKAFIYRTIFHRIKSHGSWDCSAEGLDYRLGTKKLNIFDVLQNWPDGGLHEPPNFAFVNKKLSYGSCIYLLLYKNSSC